MAHFKISNMPKWHIYIEENMPFFYNLGMTLKEYRKKWNITQLEASKIVGIPLRTYSRYENSNDPNSFKYQKAFDALKEYTKIDEETGILTFDAIRVGIQEICGNYKVGRVILFGSYAKSKATPTSDIDLLVETDLEGLDFYVFVEKLRERLNKKVDAYRIQDMNNKDILKEALLDGIKIYG